MHPIAIKPALFSLGAAGLVALSVATPAQAYADRWPDGRDWGRDWHERAYDRYDAGNPRDAVRQCSWAAKREASRYGRAEITQIRDVDRNGRGYTVSGQVVVRNSYRDSWDHRDDRWGWDRDNWSRGDSGWFRCKVAYGRVVDLDLNGLRR